MLDEIYLSKITFAIDSNAARLTARKWRLVVFVPHMAYVVCGLRKRQR